ncbi:enhanced intracellular survival protein Eis [Anoxybacteroides tepidamans]|uniref:GNAT family N-acetyltransferase n=1 Tax=Anoxybacteroides tepidamans TaxID=265948 RepID=UPI0006875DDA|nr:GNAT family N-acetyltransferase [Anoxybacillus tepidamans]
MSNMRLLSEEDYEEAFRLSEYAFQYKLTEQQKEIRKQWMNRQEILGDFENGQLAAKAHLLPFTVFIHGQEFRMSGVAGVATWPEYRRKGKVANLLKASLERMKEKGEWLSFLYPFQFHFYRKFGWELFASYKKLTIENRHLIPLQPFAKGRIERILPEHVPQKLQPMYESYIRRYNGGLKRWPFWWEHFVVKQETHAVAYRDEQNELAGYLLYEIKDRYMKVNEMVALHEEATRGLWNFICQHDSMADRVTVETSIDDPLPYLLQEPRITQEIVPYFMARIVDLENFLKAYPFAELAGTLFLHVHDAFAEWNSGIYQISENGITVFRKEKEHTSCMHPPKRGLQLDINTAAALLLGYERPLTFYKIGKLKGSEKEVEQLERMIPAGTTFIADFF